MEEERAEEGLEIGDWRLEDIPEQSSIFDLQSPIPIKPVQKTKYPLDLPTAQSLLKKVFGYDKFRPLQAEIIQNLFNQRDSLAIMPTGSGKSLCFQLPAHMFPGLTVVVSPLISLMEDQVAQLREWGITAVYLNSTLHPQQQEQ
ncbi:MAG: DEAD/DEAH box helicase, partial [Methylococcales bacterium]|nr:DEAD/DEAH box helicase [Methylococcales bacterium]